MDKLLHVSNSPHIRSKNTTSKVMLDVLIALLPTTIFGIYIFKLDALLVILTCVLSCILCEYIYEKLMHLQITIFDLSAAVTGLLLALNLSSSTPLWICIIGSFFAIIVVKQLFGGLGQNFMNPALAARCFLLISFAGKMTTFTLDAQTSATPLSMISNHESVNIFDLFIGNHAGCIGEVSTIAILIGAAYLLIKKVISYKIPLSILITFILFQICFSGNGFNINYLLSQLFSGGLMLGCFFMATDYVTSPITQKGKIVFGIIIGLLIGIFRTYGSSVEGVSYAIIFANLLVPLIEKNTLPTPFGKEGK